MDANVLFHHRAAALGLVLSCMWNPNPAWKWKCVGLHVHYNNDEMLCFEMFTDRNRLNQKVSGGVVSSITRKVEGNKMIMEGNVVGKENKFRIIFSRQ